MTRRRWHRLLAGAVPLVVLAGCGNGDDGRQARTVDVFGPYVGGEADAFAASMETFERATGIDVRYTGSVDFTTDLRQRVASGVDAPDVALVPQPGVIAELVDAGRVEPLSEPTRAAVTENYGSDARTLGVGGVGYVVPYRTSVKSLVWYRPDVFEDHGWEVPTTMEELLSLVDAIKEDSDVAPWCFSIYAGTSTGWTATDWVEDLLLRDGGIDVYDGWAEGEVEFADPQVREAFARFHDLVLESGGSAGGLRSVLQVETDEAFGPLLEDPAGCALYKQASFATAWFPDGVDIAADGDLDFFVLPGDTASRPAPLVVAGDGAVQFNSSAETSALMTYLATPESGREWARRGGYTSARATADLDEYGNEVDRRVAELLTEDREQRFDASDVMAPEIGSDLLWSEMTEWIAGTRSLDEMLDSLDDAREAIERTS